MNFSAGFVTVAFRTDDDLKGRTGDSLAWNRYRRSQGFFSFDSFWIVHGLF